MKIGVAQLNGTVGDFPGNAKGLLAAYREAVEKGAELVLAPELALCGYPPRDLIFNSQFVPENLQALDYLASEIGPVPLLVGFVDYNETERGQPFRNAAAFLHEGEIRHKVFKTLLPNYDVFDECRYFRPAEKCEPLEFQGIKLGITICEDIWTDFYLPRPLYFRDPVKELCEAGAEIILNLSASPFHLGKPVWRREMIGKVAKNHGVPVVYANCVGGNDQLVFDGHSVAFNQNGEPLGQLAGFREEVEVFDTTAASRPVTDLGSEESLYHALVTGLADYAKKCGFQRACLGLSGGIDSALTAVIAAAALGPENVRGLTMPSPFSSSGSVGDSYALAKNLGIQCDTVSIADSYESVKKAMAPVFGDAPEDVTEENMQARLRGLYLMSLSNKEGRLLLTTGNKSELAVGYCTMYGDMCGGLAVISDLPKMQVYALSRWINRERVIIPWATIDKVPSAELRPGQADQDTLPPYPELDALLELYVEKQLSSEDIIATGQFDENVVHWVVRKVDQNEWKRNQAAPGLRVSPKAFGIGRRMPLAQRFPG